MPLRSSSTNDRERRQSASPMNLSLQMELIDQSEGDADGKSVPGPLSPARGIRKLGGIYPFIHLLQ